METEVAEIARKVASEGEGNKASYNEENVETKEIIDNDDEADGFLGRVEASTRR